jgi:threonine synthase
VEAKRTMVFEFMRQLGKMPDGIFTSRKRSTGPIAIDKGVREIESYYPEVKFTPYVFGSTRHLRSYGSSMGTAQQQNFPDGYEKQIPVIDNPQTIVSILSTGNPGMYPVWLLLLKKSKGCFPAYQRK